MSKKQLEVFIDESLSRAKLKKYTPHIFIRNRAENHGSSIEVIERLVKSGDIQTGFKKMKQLGLIDWTVEAAVLKFPDLFTDDARKCADFRINVLANIN